MTTQTPATAAPTTSGNRAELLVARAHDLPRLRRRDASVLRAVHGLVAALVPFWVAAGGALAWRQPTDGSGSFAAFVVTVVLGVVLLVWPLWALRAGRRASAAYRALLVAPDDWPGAPAAVDVDAKTVADAADLPELGRVAQRDLARLQFSTTEIGLMVRMAGGGFLVVIAVLLVLAAFVVDHDGSTLALVIAAPGFLLPALVGAGGVLRRGGWVSRRRGVVQRQADERRRELGG